jgi:hypothetical protein
MRCAWRGWLRFGHEHHEKTAWGSLRNKSIPFDLSILLYGANDVDAVNGIV